MNQIHLHYTHFTTGYFAVSCIGLPPEQLKHYAKNARFLVVNAAHETQRFVSRRIHSKVSLFVALESAGYDLTISSDCRDVLPPIPATLPESSTAKTWLGDAAWYCGDAK